MTYQSTHGDQMRDEVSQGARQISQKAQEMGSEALDRAQEFGSEALDRADEYLKTVGLSVKERPMTALAVIGGVAFVAGALWMMRSPKQSRFDALGQQLSDYARRSRIW